MKDNTVKVFESPVISHSDKNMAMFSSSFVKEDVNMI